MEVATELTSPESEPRSPSQPSSSTIFLRPEKSSLSARLGRCMDAGLGPGSLLTWAILAWNAVELLVFWLFIIFVAGSAYRDWSFLSLELPIRAAVSALQIFLALKTILAMVEAGLSIAWGRRLVHENSLPVLLLQQGFVEPALMDVPMAVLLFASSCTFLTRVAWSWLGLAKLCLGLAHVGVLGLRWLLQLRAAWRRTDSLKRRRRRTLCLAVFAALCVSWSLSLRLLFLSGLRLGGPACTRRELQAEEVRFNLSHPPDPGFVAESQLGDFVRAVSLDLDSEAKVAFVRAMAANFTAPDSSLLFCDAPARLRQRFLLILFKEHAAEREAELRSAGIEWTEVDLNDASPFQAAEREAYLRRPRMGPDTPSTSYQLSSYYPHDEIKNYLRALEREHPQIVRLLSIGASVEGRDLTVVQIGRGSAGRRRGFWLDCGIHAREWITPATCLYTIAQLVEGFASGRRDGGVWELDWYILPLHNPDGYAWTWVSDETRFWRKNRSNRHPDMAAHNAECVGVDLNRNFDFAWGEPGCDKEDACSVVYCGPHAFSEPETQAVRDFILRNRDNLGAFISLHSYSQMWFVPFGHAKRNVSEDHDELMEVGGRALAALEAVHGTKFQLGTAADLMYVTSGDSSDWAKGRANITYAYGIELRPAHCWLKHQFLLPASQILPTGEEMWAAFQVVAEAVARLPR